MQNDDGDAKECINARGIFLQRVFRRASVIRRPIIKLL